MNRGPHPPTFRARGGRLFPAVPALALLVLVTACDRSATSTSDAISTRATNDIAALARSVCSACHLFPEPASLPRHVWVGEVLPRMGVWLGVEPWRDATPGTNEVRAAGILPRPPLVTPGQWTELKAYFSRTSPESLAPAPVPPSSPLTGFVARRIQLHPGLPMTSVVRIDAVRQRLYVGDAVAGRLATFTPAGEIESSVTLPSAPVRVRPGGAGLLVCLVGHLFPADIASGAVAFVPADPGQEPRLLLTNLRRPVDALGADLDGDGRPDLAVCQFGNHLGRFSWHQPVGGAFVEHPLLDRAGAVRVEAGDLDGDGRPELVVMMAQGREGIYVGWNQGGGQFRFETVTEQSPAFGFTGFELLDFDGDGRPDLLAVNGDAGDFPSPPRPDHGVRLWRNVGGGKFESAWFLPLPGATRAVAADLDGDGDQDVIAVAYHPDFGQTPPEGVVIFENEGNGRFTRRSPPDAAAGRWITMDAGDLDGDGDVDVVLGSLVLGPGAAAVPMAVREGWRTNGAAVLILENRRR